MEEFKLKLIEGIPVFFAFSSFLSFGILFGCYYLMKKEEHNCIFSIRISLEGSYLVKFWGRNRWMAFKFIEIN